MKGFGTDNKSINIYHLNLESASLTLLSSLNQMMDGQANVLKEY